MPSVHEQVSEQFATWERRGRGWQVFQEPISPEPPFRTFTGYALASVHDDGKRPTILSSLVSGISHFLSPEPPRPQPTLLYEEEPEPTVLIRESLTELCTTLPANLNASREALEAFLAQLRVCVEPVAFELCGTSERIIAQFVAHPQDVPLVRRQLIAHFPEATFQPTQNTLALFDGTEGECAVVEFGLAEEFILPIASGKLDPFVGIVGALSELREGELGLYQILFQPCREPWAENIERLVTDSSGRTLFINRPEFVSLAKEKTARPLFAAVLRVAARGATFEDAWEIVRHLAGSLRVFAHPTGNELIPLHNEGYPYEAHLEDVIRRQSRRSGMILNSDELIGLVHMPSAAVRTSRFRRLATTTKAAPRLFTSTQGLLLGENLHAGETRPVTLSADQRSRHLHCIGASGTGKSTLLFNLIHQDLVSGEGLAVLDPHGDLIERILGIIPSDRLQDVVLIDPSDETASIGFNILSAHSDLEKTLLASDLVSVFQRLSQSWGDQMESVLRNAILAFLESREGGTLADLRRFLLDAKYRERFLETIQDPDIQFYWRKGFTQLSGNKSIGPVLTRLETFLAPKPLRYMVAQKVNRLDFAHILDTGKIFLAKLAQGSIGKENAYLLGSLFMAKFLQSAMSRQNQATSSRRDFWLYVDEFQNFITPSMAEILSGARKYRLGLILAHQELRQLERDREVASSVLSNPYTRVVFRVGDSDARALESGFSSFTARDLQNLGTGEAVARIERSDFDFNLRIPKPEDPDPEQAAVRRAEVMTASRATYATPRPEIEAMLRQQFEPVPPKERTSTATEPPPEPKPAPPPPTAALLPSPVRELDPPKQLPDPGRGGEQHKTLQKRLKAAAEKLGYQAIIEYEVLDKTGSIDLAVIRAPRMIAVEISVTTTIDYEFGNVIKCLNAGFGEVAVVSTSPAKLRQIEEAVKGSMALERATKVHYYSPDAFLDYLAELAKQDAAAPPQPLAEKQVKGYTVRKSAPKLTAEERNAKEAASLRILAETLKGPPPTAGT